MWGARFRGSLILLFSLAIWCGTPGAAEVREPRQGVAGLIDAQGCRGCHRIEGKGGTFGPSLEGIGGRLNRDRLLRKLTDPAADNPEAKMPAYDHLGSEDLAALVEFLATL